MIYSHLVSHSLLKKRFSRTRSKSTIHLTKALELLNTRTSFFSWIGLNFCCCHSKTLWKLRRHCNWIRMLNLYIPSKNRPSCSITEIKIFQSLILALLKSSICSPLNAKVLGFETLMSAMVSYYSREREPLCTQVGANSLQRLPQTSLWQRYPLRA